MSVPVLAGIPAPQLPDAACAEYPDPDAFFPNWADPNRVAERVCAFCPVQIACLEYALANGEIYGVWGGLNAQQRHTLMRERGSRLAASRWAS